MKKEKNFYEKKRIFESHVELINYKELFLITNKGGET